MESIGVGSKVQYAITQVRDGQIRKLPRRDDIATEEPLEMRLITPTERKTIAITMRTPNADFELVAGFLFSEGIIRHRDDILSMRYCVDNTISEEQHYNVVNIHLAQEPCVELRGLDRHFMINSACGVCGKASLDALETSGMLPIRDDLQVPPNLISSLPDKLRQSQQIFDTTGGLHAIALFNHAGDLLAVREDIGRHNAMDKLIGWALLEDKLPLNNHMLLVSGRASFELVQKTLSANVPIFSAISAPSSLAVATAQRFNMTLIGFLRNKNFNIYTHPHRVIP